MNKAQRLAVLLALASIAILVCADEAPQQEPAVIAVEPADAEAASVEAARGYKGEEHRPHYVSCMSVNSSVWRCLHAQSSSFGPNNQQLFNHLSDGVFSGRLGSHDVKLSVSEAIVMFNTAHHSCWSFCNPCKPLQTLVLPSLLCRVPRTASMRNQA